MGARLHSDKTINAVLKKLVAQGWTLKPQGHLYHLLCPCGRDRIRVDSTPRNPETQARRIKREAARCPNDHDLTGQPTPRGRST